MTIDMSGLTAAQARVNQIQSLFGPTTPATASTSPTATAFGDAMNRAQGTPRSAAQAKTATSSSQTALTSEQRAGTSAPSTPKRTVASAQSSAPATSTAPRSTSSADDTSSSTSGLKNADAVLATAKKYLGIPYKWGGTNPNTGLDCSGFVQLVMKQHGVSLPRVSRDQARQGSRVESIADAKPGDLVAFGSPVHHIGIYVGDGKMIHAPRTGDVVKISKVHKNMTAIRRVLPEGEAAASASALKQVAAQASGASATPASAASPLPAAGIDTAKLASTLRTAALSSAVNADADSSTWQEAVASAVTQSLQGTDVENPQAAIQSALAGLGTVTPELAAALASQSTATTKATTAVNASTSATRGLAPDATGTRALDQAPARFRELFVAAERKYGVPATLLAAVAKQESNFKPNAVSHAGAQGLMQLMPGTARGLGVKDAFDPAQAVDGAARLLRSHLRTFKSTDLALAAYNAGPGAVRKYDGIPPYRETQNYVRKIMSGLTGVAA